MLFSVPARTVALGAAIATLAIALTAAPAVSVAPTAPAAAADAICLPGYGVYPNLNDNPSTGTDSAVSTYVSGDFTTLSGSAEGEGTFIIGEDATFTSRYFNLGVVGTGSRINPPTGSDMLVVGGDIDVVSPAKVEVAHNVGGNVVTGGVVTPTPTTPPTEPFTTNGGTITQNVANPLAPYASTKAAFQSQSTTYAGLTANGEVEVDGWQVTFRALDTSNRQVFTVAGNQLGSIGNTKTMVFEDIPADAIVIVNVTGTNAVIGANSFNVNGEAVITGESATTTTFTKFTQSLLWNFPTATSVVLGDNDQLLGSVLVPTASSTTTLLTSTNGRVFTGGDLVMGASNLSADAGLEIHNYGFRAEIDCAADAEGSLSIVKALDDPDSVVDADREYTGDYTCGTGVSAVTGSWTLTAGGPAFVTPKIPAGFTCTVTEDALGSGPSSDSTYAWAAPVVTPSVITVPDSATPLDVTVTNTVEHEVAHQGSLSIVKTLDDPDAVVDADRVYTGTYNCGPGVASGTWSLKAGGAPFVTPQIPSGISCAVTEDALDAAPSPSGDSYFWVTPSVSPAVITVPDSSTPLAVTVNNRVDKQVEGESGDFAVRKVLDDPFGETSLDIDYTGTFACTYNGVDVTPAPGTWSVRAGQPALTLAENLAVGTQCSVTEDALTEAPVPGFPQYRWRTPAYSAASVDVVNAETASITVTNVVYDPTDLSNDGDTDGDDDGGGDTGGDDQSTGGLASTGTDIALPLALSGLAVLLGAALFFVARRRRLQKDA